LENLYAVFTMSHYAVHDMCYSSSVCMFCCHTFGRYQNLFAVSLYHV